MKKLYLLLVVLFLMVVTNTFAQDEIKIPSYKKKNSFLVGANYAINGWGDVVAILYRQEYIRNFNKYFSGGIGIGIFNHSSSYRVFSNINHVLHEKSSIVPIDFFAYLKVIDFDRHFFRVGLGYSLMKLDYLQPHNTSTYYDDLGNPVLLTTYKTTDKFSSSIGIHVEYGFRFLPHWGTSVSGRYYSEGNSVSLSHAGLNLFYSF